MILKLYNFLVYKLRNNSIFLKNINNNPYLEDNLIILHEIIQKKYKHYKKYHYKVSYHNTYNHKNV